VPEAPWPTSMAENSMCWVEAWPTSVKERKNYIENSRCFETPWPPLCRETPCVL
ncbi:hypothetical protein A2U01_0078584, partial [Trifolium medium]|nr:hypothetical protein [Trifolium medium]